MEPAQLPCLAATNRAVPSLHHLLPALGAAWRPAQPSRAAKQTFWRLFWVPSIGTRHHVHQHRGSRLRDVAENAHPRPSHHRHARQAAGLDAGKQGDLLLETHAWLWRSIAVAQHAWLLPLPAAPPGPAARAEHAVVQAGTPVALGCGAAAALMLPLSCAFRLLLLVALCLQKRVPVVHSNYVCRGPPRSSCNSLPAFPFCAKLLALALYCLALPAEAGAGCAQHPHPGV